MSDDVEVREGDLGDGPSSAETCGQFPADEVRQTYVDEYGEGGGPGGPGDPHIDSIYPTTATAGDAATPLVVSGSAFAPDATVEVDGVAIPTTVTSETSVEGTYTPPASVASTTSQQITVRNVALAQESNDAQLTVSPAAADEEAT